MKYTKGPWVFDGTRIMREGTGDSPFHQAIASIVLTGRTGKEVFANGDLIAAAPDLFESLKDILLYYNTEAELSLDGAILKAKCAMEKAERKNTLRRGKK